SFASPRRNRRAGGTLASRPCGLSPTQFPLRSFPGRKFHEIDSKRADKPVNQSRQRSPSNLAANPTRRNSMIRLLSGSLLWLSLVALLGACTPPPSGPVEPAAPPAAGRSVGEGGACGGTAGVTCGNPDTFCKYAMTDR